MRNNLDFLHDCSELRKLLTENPKLPVIVYAGDDANTGEYQYTCCSRVRCAVGEVLDCELPFGDGRIFSDREDFREELVNFLQDLPDEEFNKALEHELKKYSPYWKKAIEVWVNN